MEPGCRDHKKCLHGGLRTLAQRVVIFKLKRMDSQTTTIHSQQAVNTDNASRITALDFTKGALVLFMVLYHWVNYFVGPNWPYYIYLRFLTPSFIFITGFMVSNVYLSKYQVTDPRLSKRLIVRGAKLFAIFMVLNIARGLLHPPSSSTSLSFRFLYPENLKALFSTGQFHDKIVAFYILVPIAYLLILSGILMIPRRRYKHTFQVSCISLFLLLAAVNFSGRKNQNLEILAIGMVGILVGLKQVEVIDRAIRHPYLLAVAYILYMIAITAWNVTYPLEVAGTCLSVAIIYLVGTIEWRWQSFQNTTVLLGKYSLCGYIIQIAILQILEAILRPIGLGYVKLLMSFLAAFALTIISVEVVDRARKSVVGIDRLYKAVFN